MKKTWNEDLICEFLSAVEEIPAGIIASYVRIARLIGRDRYARPVGKALHMASFFTAAIQVRTAKAVSFRISGSRARYARRKA